MFETTKAGPHFGFPLVHFTGHRDFFYIVSCNEVCYFISITIIFFIFLLFSFIIHVSIGGLKIIVNMLCF